MTCPRCQGLIVNEYDEERCLNCGHRTNFVPPPSAVYRPLPLVGPSPAAQTPAHVRAAKHEKRLASWRQWYKKYKATETEAQAEARRERRRAYMRIYMRTYSKRPDVREKANARLRSWQQRRAAAGEASAC